VIGHVLILWGVLGAASVLALLLHKRTREADAPELGSALSFIGAAYGLLLGLLVVFAVGHYNEVQSEAQQEATSLVSLYDAVGIYPPATRDQVRQDLYCYMRSIVNDDWPSMERGDQLESQRALARGDLVRGDLRGLVASNPTQGSANIHAATIMENADASRQRLLYLTGPNIPTALWVVIYVGAFLVFSLLAVHHGARKRGRWLSLGSAVVLMTVVVAVLSMLDHPYAFGVRVQPNQLRQAISLVEIPDKTAPTILQACK
jgi:hypothetical protein